MEVARDRLRVAHAALAAGSPSGAASAAYYAFLSAARAALSERHRNAKTHSGTWSLFERELVGAGRFERRLFEAARRTQATREAADYDALLVPTERAEEIVALAEEFVTAVAEAIA
jgi:uncharacterized protein (UPF0332 family)